MTEICNAMPTPEEDMLKNLLAFSSFQCPIHYYNITR